MEENKERLMPFALGKAEEIRLTFSEWVKKHLTAEEVEERLNKRITIGEKQKQSETLFAKRHIAKGTKW